MRAIQQKESTSTRTCYFPSDGPSLARGRVHFIYRAIANPAGKLLLEHPTLMQELTHGIDIARLQLMARLVSH
jgi:hypothetical protein